MLDHLNELFSVVLKGLMILVVIVAGVYLVICIWGNIALAQADKPASANYPSIEKAPYQFIIRNTGQSLFVKQYDTIAEGVYNLKYGHYEEKGGKWVWNKKPLPFLLDERLWGEIEVVKR